MRARLLDLAAEHHLAGSYEASVPLLLPHIEGIVIDVTGGRKYFTKMQGKTAELVNPRDLAGIEAWRRARQLHRFASRFLDPLSWGDRSERHRLPARGDVTQG